MIELSLLHWKLDCRHICFLQNMACSLWAMFENKNNVTIVFVLFPYNGVYSESQLMHQKANTLMLHKLFSKTQLGCLFNVMDDMCMNIQSDKLFHPIPKGNSQPSGSVPFLSK